MKFKLILLSAVIALNTVALTGCSGEEGSSVNGTSSGEGAGTTTTSSAEQDGESESNNNDNGSNEEEVREIAERVDFSNVAITSEDDFEYGETTRGEQGIFISDYKGSSDIVVVPDTINDLPVISVRLSGTVDNPRKNIKAIKIPDSVSIVEMMYCNNLTTVELPDEITDANGMLYFSYSPDLTYINVPNGVTNVNDGIRYGFDVSGCKSLISLELPDSVTNLGVLSSCESLESIRLSDSISRILQKAFYGCTSLKSVNIPQSCIEIERLAFKYCALESITIPANVRTIGQDAFSNNKLKTVVIEDGDVELTLVSGCFFDIDLMYVELPTRVTKIDDYAFLNYSDLTENAKLVIKCSAGSAAEKFAKANGYTCQTSE